ncbi:hypothetical protein COHA_008519 [Chlorella ohadii]|uniref:Uncharacterized protein n=1 Tax=Chlorella ohadii TaxID=2649997 RepID=A0AAD5DH93_9CHLO|nr:hypothetical protein COHA_008519 [Chlorella ohadii]
MAACGVADPKAALRRAPNLLHFDYAAAGFLQRRLLLQRCFQLTAAQLYEQHPSCLSQISVERLVQRLQFAEHRGQEGSMQCVVKAKQETFLAAVGASQAEWEAWAAASPSEACPLYGWAQQAAADEVARLAAALPPELAQGEKRPNRFKRRSQVAD